MTAEEYGQVNIPRKFTYRDHDHDSILVTEGYAEGHGKGVFIRTDSRGCVIPLTEIQRMLGVITDIVESADDDG